MSAEPPLLTMLEEQFDRLRQHHAATHNAYQDLVMTLAERFATAVDKLIARLDGHDAMLDAAKKAEVAAEAERDDLKARLAAAEDKAKADAEAMASKLSDLQAKLDAELDPAPFQAVVDKIEAVTADAALSVPAETPALAPAEPVEPVSPAAPTPMASAEPVVATAPSGATTVVVPAEATEIHTEPSTGALTMPGTVSHVDDAGTHTTVPLDGSAPSAVDAAGASVEPSQAAIAEATNAAAAAGVTVAPSA